MRISRKRREAATALECAVIAPVVFLLLLGVVIVGMGIFRYQQMASLSRDAARYASVHGTQYARETGNPAPTPTDIYNRVIAPGADGLDPTLLTYSITYNTSNDPYHTVTVNGNVVPIDNTVRVTLTYQWFPEAFFVGPFTLTSTSEMPMSY
jgi:Flp pilus assembly protein TadG